MKLSRVERLLLANQCRILEATGPVDERESYARFRKALEHGYELEYETFTQNVYPEGLGEAECEEVLKTLQMFSMLGVSYDRLGERDRATIDRYKIDFHGYDGNNETLFMTYVEFLVEVGRFTKVVAHGTNSHSPARDRYQAMLAEFRKVPAERWAAMSREEIQRITSAR